MDFTGMTRIEISEWMRANLPKNNRSIGRRKIVHGFGINDADYTTSFPNDGEQIRCSAYLRWTGIILRCYCPKPHPNKRCYLDVTVCDEWKSFMKFREWWVLNYEEGYQLDKDILTDNRMYGPDYCLYVPAWLNNFLLHRQERSLPKGVSLSPNGRFYVSCDADEMRKRAKTFDRYDTAEEAHQAWKTFKLEMALVRKPEMDAIDLRIYPRIVEMIKNTR